MGPESLQARPERPSPTLFRARIAGYRTVNGERVVIGSSKIPRREQPKLILITRQLCLAGLVLILVAQSALAKKPKVRRDWRTFPAIIEATTNADIIAVGDVHGDFKRLSKLLAAGKLIEQTEKNPNDLKWSAGKTVLICTGDLIDKGDQSLDVIACFQTLQSQAAQQGGRVIVTMGNHEAEFLSDPDDDEKAEQFRQELAAAEIDPASIAFGTDRLHVGEFLANLPMAVKINDWMFAHACSTQGMTLETLAREIQDSVTQVGFGAKVLVDNGGLLEARLHPLPWWERAGDTGEQSEVRLRGFANALGVKHFVMGHQPGKTHFSDGSKRKAGEMVQKFDGLMFLIDVGMSHAIDKSKGALLKIARDRTRESATEVDPEGSTRVLWSR